jgi:hypothetical protein
LFPRAFSVAIPELTHMISYLGEEPAAEDMAAASAP